MLVLAGIGVSRRKSSALPQTAGGEDWAQAPGPGDAGGPTVFPAMLLHESLKISPEAESNV